MKKFINIIAIISIFSYLISLPHLAFAGNNITINCTSNSCTKSSKLPLFYETNIAPGFSFSQTITVKNNRDSSCNLQFKIKPLSYPSPLANVQNLSIVSNNFVWYAGSLDKLYDEKTHQIGHIDTDQSIDYLWTVSLNQSAGNEFLLQNNNFDIDYVFTCDDEKTKNNDESNFQCRDIPPLQIPQNLRAIGGQNSVTLYWDEPSDVFTYYLIAYSDRNDASLFGNPNVGGKGTNSYVINNLSGGTQYDSKIRTGNGCAPGIFSPVISVSPSGQILTNQSPATSFHSNVLGIQETIANNEKYQNTNCIKIFPYAFILALIVNLILYRYWPINLLISVLSIFFDSYLSQFTCQKFSLFYLGNIISFLIPFVLFLRNRRP